MATKRLTKTTAASADKAVRKHSVTGSIENLELVKAKSALTLRIFADSAKLGELQVGRGSLFWRGPGRIKSKRIDWSRFAAMMDEIAYGETR